MGLQAFVPQAGTAALSKIGMSAQLSTHKYKHRPLDFVLQQELGQCRAVPYSTAHQYKHILSRSINFATFRIFDVATIEEEGRYRFMLTSLQTSLLMDRACTFNIQQAATR